MSRPIKNLGSICIDKGLQTGPFGSQLKADEYSCNGVPVVMPKDIVGGQITTRTIARIPNSKACTLSKHRLAVGDIIFSRRGDLSKIAVVSNTEDGFLCGTGCLRARPKQTINSDYLRYCLLTNRVVGWLKKHAVGQTMPNLNTEIINSLPLYLPDRDEQNKVAAILITWDQAINLTEKLIAEKQQLRKGLMQQLLTGKRRLPGFDAAWETVALSLLFKPIRRKNSSGNSLVLTASGKHGLVDQSDFFNRKVSGKDLSGYFLLKHGEFAYNRSSMNGYPYGAIKRLEGYKAGILSTLYICFAPSSQKCISNFYIHLFESGILNRQLRTIVQIGARAHGLLNVSLNDFFSMKLPMPSTKEQQAIANLINLANTELKSIQTKTDALREQKKGLMQQLLTGKKRVKVRS